MTDSHNGELGNGAANGARAPSASTRVQDYRGMLRRRWWIIAAAVTASIGVTWWGQRNRIPQYTAEVLLQHEAEAPLLTQAWSGESGPDFGTQLEILRSRSVLAPVVDSLGLQLMLRSHQELRTELVGRVEVDAGARAAGYVLESRSGRAILSDPGTGRVIATGNGATVRGPDFTVTVADLETLTEPVEFSLRERDAVMEQMERRIRVEQGKGANLIRVLYSDPDPRFAALVANATAESYRSYRTQTAREQAGRRREVILTQLVQLADSVRSAQGVLLAYQQRSQLLDPNVEGNALMSSRLQTETDLRTLRFQEGLLVSLVRGLAVSGRDTETLQQLIALGRDLVPAGSALYQRVQELESERSRLTASRFGATSNDPRVQVIDSLIAGTEADMRVAASQALEMVRARLSAAETRMNEVQGQIGSLPMRAAELTRLQQQVEGIQRVFGTLVQQYFEAEIAENSEAGDVTVVDPAHVPLWPDPTRDGLNLIIALIAGIVMGGLGAAGAEALDGRIRTTAEAQRVAKLEVLGVVPSFGSIGGRAASVLIVRESFRAIRTNLNFLGSPAPKVFVVTSPAPGEGKSTISANLALTMADQGARVLLVDADLRRPLLHTIFGAQQAPGVTDVVVGGMPLRQALQTRQLPEGSSFHLLTSGTPGEDPSRLFTSAAFDAFLLHVRGCYDVVLFDTPPLLATVDTLPIASRADSLIVVVRVGRTEADSLSESVAHLRRVKIPLAGIIFNAVPASHTQYHRYRDYYTVGNSGRKRSSRPVVWPAETGAPPRYNTKDGSD